MRAKGYNVEVEMMCTRCRQFHPVSVINVDEWVSHGAPLECKDRQDCERAAHRRRKKARGK